MSDPDTMEEAFRRLFKLFDRLRVTGAQTLGKTNFATLVSLTYRQMRALSFIADGEKATDGGIHQIDLARSLGTTVPATSVLVDSLVKKNLALRQPSLRDRRSFCLRLTERGRKVFALSQKSIRELAAQLTEGLSKQDKAAFIRVVAHFHQKLDD